MRDMKVTIGGRELKLVANFKAAAEIAKEVEDPLVIARESVLEAMMLERRLPYNPKWTFTVENIPQILFIGAEAAGEKITLIEMQDLVFEEGFSNCRAAVVEYLSLLVGPKPETKLDDVPEKKAASAGN